jgi:hypothetical protein
MAVKHIQVRLEGELAEWFDENFPGLTKQDFGAQCFRALRAAVEEGRILPTSEIGDIVIQGLFNFRERD